MILPSAHPCLASACRSAPVSAPEETLAGGRLTRRLMLLIVNTLLMHIRPSRTSSGLPYFSGSTGDAPPIGAASEAGERSAEAEGAPVPAPNGTVVGHRKSVVRKKTHPGLCSKLAGGLILRRRGAQAVRRQQGSQQKLMEPRRVLAHDLFSHNLQIHAVTKKLICELLECT